MPQVWRPNVDRVGESMTIDLGSAKKIKGLVTQGDLETGDHVQTYNAEYSLDGVTFIGTDQIMRSLNGDIKVARLFRDVFTARYVRILPAKWFGRIALRAGTLALPVCFRFYHVASLSSLHSLPVFFLSVLSSLLVGHITLRAGSLTPMAAADVLLCACPSGQFMGGLAVDSAVASPEAEGFRLFRLVKDLPWLLPLFSVPEAF